jgi:NAD(P)-dependent dehydrogenase (short-subunit alcohol dehydrogenase family)
VRDLEGSGIVITGGAGDIGAAMGRELAERGAVVTLIDVKMREEAECWIKRAREGGGDSDTRRPTCATGWPWTKR